MKNFSLKTRLLGLVGILAVVALAVFFEVQHEAIKAVDLSKAQSAKRAAEDVLDKLDRNLFERYGDVQAFAVSEPARSGDKARIVAFMADMMPTYAPIYQLMMVVNSKGKVIAVNEVDKDGKPLNSQEVYTKDYSQEPWFQKAMGGEIKPGTSFVEDLHVDSDVASIYKGKGYVMNFTAPIMGPNQKILGVWTNRVSWPDVVEQIIKEQAAALKSDSISNIVTFLTSPKGLFLAHPNKDFILTQNQDGFENLVLEMANGSVARAAKLNEAELSGAVFQGSAKSKGYSLYPGIGWTATVSLPATDPLKVRFFYIAIIAALVIGVSTLYGYTVVNSVTKEIQGIGAYLASQASELKTTAISLDGSSQELASGSSEQSSSLQETASSIEEISSMVNKSADSASRASKVASTSSDTATKGKETVEQMIQSIEKISASNTMVMDQFAHSNQQLSNIIKVISEIGSKTKIINDIVFQTKLLSFNASVEAARAGEHGKGFAVVAEEVGNLAQMSGNAAKEIGDMLNESISTVQKIVDETKGKVERLISESKVKIEEGTAVAKECGLVLEEIVKNENEMNLMIGEVSTASQEQATGVSEINKAVAELDKVTHRTSSVAQNTAHQATNISNKASEIDRQVSFLETIIRGKRNVSEGSGRFSELPVEKPSAKSAAKEKNLGANVVKLPVKPQKVKTSNVVRTDLKTAVGADEHLPSENDPRFEEI